jgi:hypothetical protein
VNHDYKHQRNAHRTVGGGSGTLSAGFGSVLAGYEGAGSGDLSGEAQDLATLRYDGGESVLFFNSLLTRLWRRSCVIGFQHQFHTGINVLLASSVMVRQVSSPVHPVHAPRAGECRHGPTSRRALGALKAERHSSLHSRASRGWISLLTRELVIHKRGR